MRFNIIMINTIVIYSNSHSLSEEMITTSKQKKVEEKRRKVVKEKREQM